MVGRKIELDDLINLKDGTTIDITNIDDVKDSPYNLVCEEVDEFLAKPKLNVNDKKKINKSAFYTHIPAADLKNSIDALLKTRDV